MVEMNNLEVLMQMRKTLEAMNEQLTPYSGKVEHQRYLDNLHHYKRALNSYNSRANEELDRSIRKSYEIIKGYITTDINNAKKQIIDGKHYCNRTWCWKEV